MTRTILAAVPLVGALVLAGCGGASDAGSSGSSDPGALPVVAAFYPLGYALERVGGKRVDVTSLTKPGAEPHDVELTPRDVADLGRSSLVVYEKGFQPAVDDAISSQVDAAKALDVATEVDLTVAATDDGHDHGGGEEHGDEGAVDPHFWLDPTRYASAVKAIAEKLAALDPAGATAYRANAETMVAELTTLDTEFASGLKTCTTRDLVTGHVAFAYLADRYDLHQSGVSGLSPDAEPNAATMKDIVEHVREHKVSTIYAEPLVSRDLTETIAKESGATVAVLDPIEGLSKASAGTDYFEIMQTNLTALRKGLGCS